MIPTICRTYSICCTLCKSLYLIIDPFYLLSVYLSIDSTNIIQASSVNGMNEQNKTPVWNLQFWNYMSYPIYPSKQCMKQIIINTYICKHRTRGFKKVGNLPRVPSYLAEFQEFELSLSNHKSVLRVSGLLTLQCMKKCDSDSTVKLGLLHYQLAGIKVEI